MIIGGVAFFSYETSQLLELQHAQSSGRGRFLASRRRSERHVIVAGGAVAHGGSTVADFLAELCHPARGESVPEVVLMAPGEPSPQLSRLLAKAWARRHVTYLVGSVLVRKDLARAQADRASMVFILADLAAADPVSEDEETVLRAAAVRRLCPHLPMRVLLIRKEARALAENVGLPPKVASAAHELAPKVMALGARCVGAPALLFNLARCKPLSTDHPSTSGGGRGRGGGGCFADEDDDFAWLREYGRGARQQVHGALAGPELDGRTFHEAAGVLYVSGVTLLAVQKGGGLLLNPPGSVLREGDVIFALGLHPDHVAVRREGSTGERRRTEQAPAGPSSRV